MTFITSCLCPWIQSQPSAASSYLKTLLSDHKRQLCFGKFPFYCAQAAGVVSVKHNRSRVDLNAHFYGNKQFVSPTHNLISCGSLFISSRTQTRTYIAVSVMICLKLFSTCVLFSTQMLGMLTMTNNNVPAGFFLFFMANAWCKCMEYKAAR